MAGVDARVLGLPRFSLAYLYKQYWSAERVFPRRAPIATGILNVHRMCCSNVDLTTCRCGHLVYLGVLECVYEDLWERKVGQIPVLFWRINLLGRRRGSKMVQHQHLPRFFPYQ